jgi:predicted Zn-dependent peptidase
VLNDGVFLPERKVVAEERKLTTDSNPSDRFFEDVMRRHYTHHTYGHPVIGWGADIQGYTFDDALGWYKHHYAPNNATITIAGDFNADSAKTWVRKYFGNIPRNAEIARPVVPAVALKKDTVMMMEDRVQLPRAYYVWHSVKTFSPDDAALDALTDIIAGGKSSRLYRTLVYEKQIAQDVSMGNSSSKQGLASSWCALNQKPLPLHHGLQGFLFGQISPSFFNRAGNSYVRNSCFCRILQFPVSPRGCQTLQWFACAQSEHFGGALVSLHHD